MAIHSKAWTGETLTTPLCTNYGAAFTNPDKPFNSVLNCYSGRASGRLTHNSIMYLCLKCFYICPYIHKTYNIVSILRFPIHSLDESLQWISTVQASIRIQFYLNTFQLRGIFNSNESMLFHDWPTATRRLRGVLRRSIYWIRSVLLRFRSVGLHDFAWWSLNLYLLYERAIISLQFYDIVRSLFCIASSTWPHFLY